MKFNINHVVIAACGAIIITEVYEWYTSNVANWSASLVVLSMAVVCIMVNRNKGA